MQAESDARHERQMVESKWQMDESKQQMDEYLVGVKAMLQGFKEYMPITQIMQVLKMLPLIYFQLRVYRTALLCTTNTMSIIYSG